MPEIYYVQRGNRKYAYRSTSVYEPGSKYPKTVNEYIGILDEESGKIIPKKNRVRADSFLSDEDITGKRFGGSHMLKSISERIGLREDLFYCFGPEGDRILACAVAQALSGGPFSSVEDTVDGCLIGEMLGLEGRFSSPRLSEFTKFLGESLGSLENLFERRLARAEGTLTFDLTSVSSHSRMREWAEWGYNRDKEKMKQLNFGLVTDKSGVPVMFELYPGSIPDLRTLERTVERVGELKEGDCSLIMDRGFGSASNLKYLLEKEVSFVIPGKKATRCVKALLSRLVKEKHHADSLRLHDEHTYSVLESEVAIVPRAEPETEDEDSNDTAEYELILPEDPRFADAPENMRMKAYACYDRQKAAEDADTVYKAILDIEKRLSEVNPYTAVKDVKRLAGPYAKYFDLSVDGEGRLRIERRKNAMSFSMNRNGMFVMFCKGIEDWEDMMSCYDCRTYVEQAFDVMKNELDGNRFRTKDPQTAKGRLLIKFVALILWCTMAKELRDSRHGEPVRTVLQSMDNILAIGKKGEWRVLEITKRNRRFMDDLKVPHPPKTLVLKPYTYIPESALADS